MTWTELIILYFTVYTLIYCRKHVYRIRIYSNNPIIASIKPRIVFPFYFIPFGFFQTIIQLFRKVEIVRGATKSSFILRVDGDVDILVDVYEPGCKVDGTRDNVLLIHGLNGSSKSTYVIGMANVFLKRDCRVFCYNVRGAQIPPKSNVFSHHGLTSDIQAAVEHILSNYSGSISLIGFSLGSNWVTKLLGEYSHPRIKMGVSVCCPFDFASLNKYYKEKYYLTKCVTYFMSRNYKRYLRRSMVSAVNLNGCYYPDEIDTEVLEFLGKNSLEEFYRESSCISYIHKINVPCLFISAEDDPIIPAKVIPFEECINNKNTGIILLKGGHLGFFTNKRETMAEVLAGEFYDRIEFQPPTDGLYCT